MRVSFLSIHRRFVRSWPPSAVILREFYCFSGFGAIGGASGAFVHLYIDALADAGVRAGFSRPLAVELATQTVLGSARLVEETREHPIALMNQVCSPAGTTIEGVMTLKKRGFEAAVQDGIEAIIRRDQELSKG